MTTTIQSHSLINDFADFLVAMPTRDEIVNWRPSDSVIDRYNELVAKRKDGKLAADEEGELEAYLNSEIVLSLLKARLSNSAN